MSNLLYLFSDIQLLWFWTYLLCFSLCISIHFITCLFRVCFVTECWAVPILRFFSFLRFITKPAPFISHEFFFLSSFSNWMSTKEWYWGWLEVYMWLTTFPNHSGDPGFNIGHLQEFQKFYFYLFLYILFFSVLRNKLKCWAGVTWFNRHPPLIVSWYRSIFNITNLPYSWVLRGEGLITSPLS